MFYIYNGCHNVKINIIINIFPSKSKADNDAFVRYFIKGKLFVVKEIVNPIHIGGWGRADFTHQSLGCHNSCSESSSSTKFSSF